jgi:hypothetical protein
MKSLSSDYINSQKCHLVYNNLKKNMASKGGASKNKGNKKEVYQEYIISSAIQEIKEETKFGQRARVLFGILIVVRALIVLVITPVQNMTWNRKNAFDVSHRIVEGK